MTEQQPTPVDTGLTAAEAAQRLATEGYNELSQTRKRQILSILLDVLKEPMFALLLAASGLYLLLGDLTEALILTLFASLSVTIAVVQEARSEKVLEALRDMTSPRALVVRDGQRLRIQGRDVVRGDILIIKEGDRVAADALLLSAHDIAADESLLTGESVPVHKRIGEIDHEAPARPGGDHQPFIYAGTMIVRGQGIAQVTATGKRSEIGKIGQSLDTIDIEPPRLRAQTRKLVRFYAILGLFLSAAAILLYGTLRGDWLQAVLGGIALGMSMLPEEFPLVLTVFMVMGAWRISKAHVLTRRASAIETLGATTVLCTDKTGTLTLNQMSVVALEDQDGSFFFETSTTAPERFQPLIRLAALASVEDPHDPMESAIHRLTDGMQKPQGDLQLLKTYGLRPELLAVTRVWKQADGTQLYACKGAPETVAMLCGLPPEALKTSVEAMAQHGIRVLAVAQAIIPDTDLPETIKGLPFRYAGLIGLADPLRESVLEAVATCRAAGIKVVMITGDYPVTARAIATQAGLAEGAVLTGDDLSRLSDNELQTRIPDIAVFARIMPEQKLRIVQAFKAHGEIVAMTGDGVNDAPALQAAHIGIAMGRRGTDVAREAASIVLLEDDFDSIVQTIRLGRRIYNNLQKVMRYIIAVHIPIAGMALLPIAIGHPLVLLPIHIALLEMLIDPVCAIVFEAEDEGKDLMRHKPRDPQAPLIPAGLMLLSFLQGLLALVGVAGMYFWFHAQGLPEDQVRALSFTALVVSNIALIFTNRTLHPSIKDTLRRKNPLMIWVALATTAIMTALLTIPPLEKLLKFGAVHGDDIALTFAVCLAIFLAAEGMKTIRHAILHSVHKASEKN